MSSIQIPAGGFEVADAWGNYLPEATYVYEGARSNRMHPSNALYKIFAPVVSIDATATDLTIRAMLRNASPGLWTAHLTLTMYDESFNQKVVRWDNAFDYHDALDTWHLRTVPVSWYPLDPTRLYYVIFSLTPVSFGGGLAYIDDWRYVTPHAERQRLSARRTATAALSTRIQ